MGNLKKLSLAVAVAAAVLASGAGVSQADFFKKKIKYKVTVTNITEGTLFTPLLIATHKAGIKIFTLGSSASDGIEHTAEAGDTSFLKTSLEDQGATTVELGAPLFPGMTVEAEIEAKYGDNHISLGGMLVPTNDGFVALNGVQAPIFGKKVYYSPGYDAGTEKNDESCVNVPGPQCGGEGYNASRDGAEGYVHIHSGIHGNGDLSEDDYDWRNPVARIVIERVLY